VVTARRKSPALPGKLPADAWKQEIAAIEQRFDGVRDDKAFSPHPFHYVRLDVQPLDPNTDPALIDAHLRGGHRLRAKRNGQLVPTKRELERVRRISRTDRLVRAFTIDLVVMAPPVAPRLYVIDEHIDRDVTVLDPFAGGGERLGPPALLAGADDDLLPVAAPLLAAFGVGYRDGFVAAIPFGVGGAVGFGVAFLIAYVADRAIVDRSRVETFTRNAETM
jgi:hypothetical protein